MKSLTRILAVSALFLVSLSAGEVPRKAPEFAMQTPQGKMSLSQYQGKVLCVEFLYTTCPHCQHASQLMSKLQAEYGPKGFQAIGVAFNDMSQMLVPDFIRDFKVSYPVGWSQREAVHAYLQNDPNSALHIPQIVFIDKKGMIRHQSLPREDSQTATEPFMRKMIETLLKEPSAAPVKRKKAA